MPTIEVVGYTYETYATVSDADEWNAVSLSWEEWMGIPDENSDDEKGRYLVLATRHMDRLVYVNAYNTRESRMKAVTDGTNDGRVLNSACAEWAGLMAADMENASPADDSQPLNNLSAGPVSLEFGQSRATAAPASVSEDAVTAARLNMPTAVFSILKSLLSYGDGDRIGGSSPSLAPAFGKGQSVSLPTGLDDVA